MSIERHGGGETERGKYIVLEGGDGCGKDTQVENLKEWVEQDLGYPVEIVREPYGPIVGDFIKELLMSREEGQTFGDLDSWQQSLLVNAARRGTLKEVAGHLDNGTWVLSSRNYLSTTVYQGHLGDIEDLQHNEGAWHTFRAINLVGTAVEGAHPDLVLILDIDPEVARERTKDKDLDVFERRPLEVQQRVRQAYLFESDKYRRDGPGVVDANRSELEVFEDIKTRIGALAVSGKMQ